MTKKKTTAKAPLKAAPTKLPPNPVEQEDGSPDPDILRAEIAAQDEREAAYNAAQATRAKNPENIKSAKLAPGTTLPKGVTFESEVRLSTESDGTGTGTPIDPRAMATEEQVGDILVACGEALVGTANHEKIKIIWRATRFALGERKVNPPEPPRDIEQAVTLFAHATVPQGTQFVNMARRWLLKAKDVEFQAQVLNALPDTQDWEDSGHSPFRQLVKESVERGIAERLMKDRQAGADQSDMERRMAGLRLRELDELRMAQERADARAQLADRILAEHMQAEIDKQTRPQRDQRPKGATCPRCNHLLRNCLCEAPRPQATKVKAPKNRAEAAPTHPPQEKQPSESPPDNSDSDRSETASMASGTANQSNHSNKPSKASTATAQKKVPRGEKSFGNIAYLQTPSFWPDLLDETGENQQTIEDLRRALNERYVDIAAGATKQMQKRLAKVVLTLVKTAANYAPTADGLIEILERNAHFATGATVEDLQKWQGTIDDSAMSSKYAAANKAMEANRKKTSNPRGAPYQPRDQNRDTREATAPRPARRARLDDAVWKGMTPADRRKYLKGTS